MNYLTTKWQNVLQQMPLIAILRGVSPAEAESVGQVIIEAGFRIIEVPLNSPTPFQTIEILSRTFGEAAIIGAGTVLTAEQVTSTKAAGGEIAVAPNLDGSVASAARQEDMIYCPGIATPTEAFTALQLGATALKLFPAELICPAVLRAMRAVLPATATLLPVGGITPDNMSTYVSAGANGFGIGSALYKPGKSICAIAEAAGEFVHVYRQIQDR